MEKLNLIGNAFVLEHAADRLIRKNKRNNRRFLYDYKTVKSLS